MEENTIFVGRKHLSAYIAGVLTQVQQGKEKIILKARGKVVSKAVDLAEICTKKIIPDFKINDIKTDTVERTAKDNEGKEFKLNVSTIEIVLKKGK